MRVIWDQCEAPLSNKQKYKVKKIQIENTVEQVSLAHNDNIKNPHSTDEEPCRDHQKLF